MKLLVCDVNNNHLPMISNVDRIESVYKADTTHTVFNVDGRVVYINMSNVVYYIVQPE